MRPMMLLLLMLLATASAGADFIVLKNGKVLRGEVLSNTATEIELKMPTLVTKIPHSDILQINKEKPEVYFEQVSRNYLKKRNWIDAARLLDRGKKTCPDAKILAVLLEATELMQSAIAAEQKMQLAQAIELAGTARAKAPKVGRFAKELERLTAEKKFLDEKGCLPGPFLEHLHYKVTVLHHHRSKAEQWAKSSAKLIKDLVKQIRRSRSHKLPSESRLVLVVYRDQAEFEAATKKAKPHSELPQTEGGRLMSRTRAVTHMGAIDKALAPLVLRWTARQMFEVHPTWMIEGLVVGGADKKQEAKHRDAAANLKEAEKLLTIKELFARTHYGKIEDFVARQRFLAQSGSFVRYCAGLPDGLRGITRAVEKARNMMLYALLDPRVKHYRLKSYRIEDLIPQFMIKTLPEKLGFKNLAALEKDYHHWIATGGRKGKKPRKRRR